MHRRHFMMAGATLAGSAALPAWSQSYPDRTIKIYQGFAAGGNADTIARVVSTEMTKGLGQPFVVEAQTGAGGTIAAGTVARAKPDGYTLLLATGGHAVAGALYNNLAYKTVADFEMVSTITYFPFLFVTAADSKYRSFAELLAAARATPRGVAYGSAGIGSTHHLAGELLGKMAQADLLHVPYRGDAASLTALLAGDVPFIIAPPTAVMSNIKAGKLKAIAVGSPKRLPVLPDVPTLIEAGLKNADVDMWYGLFAPKDTPADIIARLNKEVVAILGSEEARQAFSAQGLTPTTSTPAALGEIVARDRARWAEIVAKRGITPE